MSDKDSVTKQYMQDNNIFADAFNFFLYDGEQVIKPEQLRPLDTTSVAMPYSNEQYLFIQKYRDLLKLLSVMEVERL